jgi:hypothetical protein
MNRVKIALAFAVVVALCGCGPCGKKAVAPTLSPGEEILTEAVKGWQVGQWCTYRLTSAGGKKSEVTISLTGSENKPGGDRFWLEVVADRGGEKVITKALVPQLERVTFLTGAKDLTKDSERLIVKVRNDPAIELPIRELKLAQQIQEKLGQGPDLNEIFGGGEGVTSREDAVVPYETLAGKKVTCRKIVLSKEGRDVGFAYGSDDVPIFGIAYSEHEGGKLELVDYGSSGANSLITEEPQKLDFFDLAKDLKGLKIK